MTEELPAGGDLDVVRADLARVEGNAGDLARFPA